MCSFGGGVPSLPPIYVAPDRVYRPELGTGTDRRPVWS